MIASPVTFFSRRFQGVFPAQSPPILMILSQIVTIADFTSHAPHEPLHEPLHVPLHEPLHEIDPH